MWSCRLQWVHRWCGFVTGLGAALSDIIYALMTGFGMSFIMETIESPTVAFWIKVVGSVLLFLFGLFTFKSNPIERVKPVSHNKGTLFHNFISGFLVTISNPLIIFLFIAMYGQMTFILPDSPLYWLPLRDCGCRGMVVPADMADRQGAEQIQCARNMADQPDYRFGGDAGVRTDSAAHCARLLQIRDIKP